MHKNLPHNIEKLCSKFEILYNLSIMYKWYLKFGKYEFSKIFHNVSEPCNIYIFVIPEIKYFGSIETESALKFIIICRIYLTPSMSTGPVFVTGTS